MLENKHASAKSNSMAMERSITICRCIFGLVHNIETVFYKKPSSSPSTKSFLIFGHILVLKVS